jgi:hypothetical protein
MIFEKVKSAVNKALLCCTKYRGFNRMPSPPSTRAALSAPPEVYSTSGIKTWRASTTTIRKNAYPVALLNLLISTSFSQDGRYIAK